mmetsp:Transcript_54101/g.166461  ORF Transcript_54101/g.166461 Transcript_54101/m.166461 type:complete len:180 (+) Transcript_54101:172-711(+)
MRRTLPPAHRSRMIHCYHISHPPEHKSVVSFTMANKKKVPTGEESRSEETPTQLRGVESSEIYSASEQSLMEASQNQRASIAALVPSRTRCFGEHLPAKIRRCYAVYAYCARSLEYPPFGEPAIVAFVTAGVAGDIGMASESEVGAGGVGSKPSRMTASGRASSPSPPRAAPRAARAGD